MFHVQFMCALDVAEKSTFVMNRASWGREDCRRWPHAGDRAQPYRRVHFDREIAGRRFEPDKGEKRRSCQPGWPDGARPRAALYCLWMSPRRRPSIRSRVRVAVASPSPTPRPRPTPSSLRRCALRKSSPRVGSAVRGIQLWRGGGAGGREEGERRRFPQKINRRSGGIRRGFRRFYGLEFSYSPVGRCWGRRF